MSKPQLFISHSTSDNDSARKALLALADAVKEDCRLLFDRTSLKEGEDWRSAINVWTGTCDAAVVFITPEALTSEYCQYEWSILSYRHKLAPRFPVIPVYAGVALAEMSGKPHQITEIEGITLESIDAAASAIIERLRTVSTGSSPSELQAAFVATLLEAHVKKTLLLEPAAKLANFELGQWNPFEDEWRRFTLRLMGLGVRRATIALRELKVHFRDAESDLRDLHMLVAASWVDLWAADVIAKARGADVPPTFGLNAEEVRTAALYVLRASGRSPSDSWMVAETHGSFADLEGLRADATAALAQKLKLDPLSSTLEEVQTELAIMKSFNQPVFLAVPGDTIDPTWLAALRETFPDVAIFLLTGSQLPLPEITALEPPIAKGFEAKFWGDYDQAKKILDR